MINLLLMILYTIHAGYGMKGGFLAQMGEFKYIASIRIHHMHRCCGVIIDENHIVSVAHRIAQSTVAELRVVVGKIAISSHHRDQHFVKDMYFHPGFEIRSSVGKGDNIYYEHDIAVLRLERRLIWTPSISPVSLTYVEYDWDHHFDCILISWNLPNDGRKPMILKWEFVKLMGNEVHQQWASYLGQNQKFLSDRFGTAAIDAEDLGSPLVCGNFMTGLIIKEEQREIPEKPSIVLSIAPYVEFIDEIVHDGLFKVEPEEFPYVASIWYNGTYACGGFIVDATHVATVGHCIVGYIMDYFIISVGFPQQLFSLVSFEIHSNYKVQTTDVSPGWYIDHDFALLTLATPISWHQRANPLPLADSDDFYAGKLCKVLRWTFHREETTGAEWTELMTSRVIILNSDCSQPQLDPDPQSQVPSFWGQSQYLIPMANPGDVGNPIICDNNPVGFLIQAIPSNGENAALVARFLKIRPYIESRNGSWFHRVR